VLGHEDCQVANSRSTGPQQQNDRNCSGDKAERSTSADWRTADADDQQRRQMVCSCSPGTTEPFHEETDTKYHQQHGSAHESRTQPRQSSNTMITDGGQSWTWVRPIHGSGWVVSGLSVWVCVGHSV